jgi:hypothetical protein
MLLLTVSNHLRYFWHSSNPPMDIFVSLAHLSRIRMNSYFI